jgi:glycine cleavage system H protein
MLKFTQDHEWLKIDGDEATIGITDYAAKQLGELVFVELPDLERAVKQGDAVVVVESCKAASDVYAPVDGTIVAVNDKVVDTPSLVNSEALTAGWLFKLKMTNPAQLDGLMDEKTYTDLVGDGQ